MEVQGSETPVRGGGPKVVSTPTQLRTAADTEVEAHTPSTARNRETEKQRNRETEKVFGGKGGREVRRARESEGQDRDRERQGERQEWRSRGERGVYYINIYSTLTRSQWILVRPAMKR